MPMRNPSGFREQWGMARGFLTPLEHGAVADGVTDDSAAILETIQVVSDGGGGTVFFPPGVYSISHEITPRSVSNVMLKGHGGRASIIKRDGLFTADHTNGGEGFSGLITFIDSNNITVRDMGFEGITTGRTGGLTNFDRGLRFWGCSRTRVLNNDFKNLGDEALNISTKTLDADGEVISPTPSTSDHNDTWVMGNHFDNVGSTSTTPGGTKNLIFAYNIIDNVHGAIKFASRLLDCGHLLIESNILRGSNTQGFDVYSCANVCYVNNDIYDVANGSIRWQVNTVDPIGFTMQEAPMTKIIISGNTIHNVGLSGGILIENPAYADGTRILMEDILISNNRITDIDATAFGGGIYLSDGPFRGVKIVHNYINTVADAWGIIVRPRAHTDDSAEEIFDISYNTVIGKSGGSKETIIHKVEGTNNRNPKRFVVHNNMVFDGAAINLSGIDELSLIEPTYV